jgi:hypothetical protein
MKIYQCTQRFFATPFKRYIPVGAYMGRYENAVRLVLQDAPQSDQDPFTTLMDGWVFDDPSQVSWFHQIESSGSVNNFFVLIGTRDEDAFGNVTGGSSGDGLIVRSGIPYLKNASTGKYHEIRTNGPDGSVTLEIAQVGVVL